MNHVFILGVPRSGTTLMKNLLTAHPAFIGVDGESTGLFRFRNFDAYLIDDIPAARLREITAAGQNMVQIFDAVAAEVLQAHGASRFVDKVTINRLRLCWLARHYPQAQFVHIVRDCRDCYCSALGHPNIPQARDPFTFAAYWTRCVQVPEGCLRPERLITLRYEDLTSQPGLELGKVMTFLGATTEPRQLTPEHYGHTALRHRKIHANLTRSIGTFSVGRWRDTLRPDQEARMKEIAHPMMARYGYLDTFIG